MPSAAPVVPSTIIKPRAMAACTLDVAIAIGGRQDDDVSLWKLSPNCDERVGAVGARKAKIHQSDVGSMTTNFSAGRKYAGRSFKSGKALRLPQCRRPRRSELRSGECPDNANLHTT